MAFSRQTLTYIAWAAAQVAVLGGVAWFADRQMALGFSDSAGWRPFTWPFSAEEAAPYHRCLWPGTHLPAQAA